ncbi:MAG: hypothetical protein GY937_07145 [bacterium]|nr:hypothetical protein [bacterium]
MGELLDHVPEDQGPILDAIGSVYLPCLSANAEAWKQGAKRFDVDIEGAPYRSIRTARYRVWCLEELRRHFDELTEPQQVEARARLEAQSPLRGRSLDDRCRTARSREGALASDRARQAGRRKQLTPRRTPPGAQ